MESGIEVYSIFLINYRKQNVCKIETNGIHCNGPKLINIQITSHE